MQSLWANEMTWEMVLPPNKIHGEFIRFHRQIDRQYCLWTKTVLTILTILSKDNKTALAIGQQFLQQIHEQILEQQYMSSLQEKRALLEVLGRIRTIFDRGALEVTEPPVGHWLIACLRYSQRRFSTPNGLWRHYAVHRIFFFICCYRVIFRSDSCQQNRKT